MLEYLMVIIGFVLVVKGAQYLVEGSSSLAKRLGVSSLVIGLTVVAFGTSLPELIINVIAAIKGTTDVAIGNIVGSNISNILLILGVAAIIMSLKIQKSTLWNEIPLSFFAAVVLMLLANNFFTHEPKFNLISRPDSAVLLALFVAFLIYVYILSKRGRADTSEMKVKEYKGHTLFFMITGGMVGLFLGGKWVVDGAVAIATQFGVSEFAISATIVAVGTSLPELVTSVVATIRKEASIAVGNIVGSNIFNIFMVLGISSLIRPIPVAPIINVDMFFLVFISLLLFVFILVRKAYELERWSGITFVLMYISYIVYIFVRG